MGLEMELILVVVVVKLLTIFMLIVVVIQLQEMGAEPETFLILLFEIVLHQIF